jgi:hypothetical protein
MAGYSLIFDTAIHNLNHILTALRYFPTNKKAIYSELSIYML